MSIGAINGSSFAAMATGVRAELGARVTGRALESAGILEGGISEGFAAVEKAGRDLTIAGVAAMKSDLVGTLIDVLG